MRESDEKKEQSAQPLTDDELNAVAGGKGGSGSIKAKGQVSRYGVFCSRCGHDYGEEDIIDGKCPHGHPIS